MTPLGTWLLLDRSFALRSEGSFSFTVALVRVGDCGDGVEASCGRREMLSFCLVRSFPGLLKGMICFSKPQRLLLALGGESDSSDESFSTEEL